MKFIETITELEGHYGQPVEASIVKVARRMTPSYRAWIERSRFCILSTVGPEGTDASPRGDDGPVVREIEPGMLALPDWRGNNRMDSLRNIVRDPRVSLMFFVPGSANVIRVNGSARLTADQELRQSFEHEGKLPRTVILIGIEEVYSQCARALLRARVWTSGDESAGLPTVGDMLAELTQGRIDGAAYDADWPRRAKASLW
ncbi:pyridoxamine 5'-phosphate oxidase family protein [Frigidibacter sp. RF13]|uniref:pyridoxamine 5'-phosphate oxidase family protein n=1 Tax=Frigidibacter sp. RF13 TaxID=2997340 RepID=UPI00226DD8D3|nr:pyridoxamine 5'-phosphate oxidase family protein [Frigidibacter sp. RF13]MCY1128685.1 pyridoxamine 5'-phosphate oxidase family protein [Frigidibacter sp. RF13]